MAAFLKGRVGVARIVHSGKKRAEQTAGILGSPMAPGREIAVLSGIDPLDPPEPIVRQIERWTEDTLMVGHQPFLGKLVSRLVSGTDEPAIVSFHPGTMVCLERQEQDGRWVLRWLLRPELVG